MRPKHKTIDTADLDIASSHAVPQSARNAAKNALIADRVLNRIIGRSKAADEVRTKIKQVANFDICVLITGESGTGKELAARAIHYLGPRRGKPFIPVNCGAIPENLFENEFFGHARGAYTDAGGQQNGLVGAAEGGTLFLDEIATTSTFVQVKFLRLLENREYRPLGDTQPRKVDIRIIAATNKSLPSLVEKELFREDFYYRLNVFNLHIPPLRNRREDIPILAEHFVAKYAKMYGKKINRIPSRLIESLCALPWRGNIRELENLMQRLIVLSPSETLDSSHLQNIADDAVDEPEHFRTAKARAVKAFERNYLTRILRRYRGNVAKAAAKCGKSRTAMWNLIKKHDLQPKSFR